MDILTKTAISVTAMICANNILAAPPLNNIVANWHLDEGRGQKVLDSSGYAKAGQLGGSSGIDSADPLWVSRRFDNAALEFDGSQFVKVPYAKQLEPQKISVEAWVQAQVPDDPSILPTVVAKSGNGCSFAAYSLYLHDSADKVGGVPYFYVSDGTNYFESPEGGPSLWDGKWHHLVGTYDMKAVRLYVDGVEIGKGTPLASPVNYASFINKDLYIGDYDGNSDICTDYNNNYKGKIDEVRIWNKALSPTEVAARYQGH